MAVLKVLHKQNEEFLKLTRIRKYQDNDARATVIDYALNENKCVAFGGYGVDPGYAALQMELLAKAFGNDRRLRLRHFVLSFSQDEADCMGEKCYEYLEKIGWDTAFYYAKDYQIVFAVHQDSVNPHIHFIMNTVNFNTGRKYNDSNHGADSFQHFVSCLKGYLRKYFDISLRVMKDDGYSCFNIRL